jgi:hypothetical protein
VLKVRNPWRVRVERRARVGVTPTACSREQSRRRSFEGIFLISIRGRWVYDVDDRPTACGPCLNGSHGAFWCVLVRFGAFWCVLVRFGALFAAM